MVDCTCPKDWRELPGDRRVTVMSPRAAFPVQFNDKEVVVYDKLCPLHGYTVVEKE